MTREEKEHIGKYILEMAKLLEDGCYQQEILLGAVHIIDEALEQESTTKNDLGVYCIARQDVERYIEGFINKYTPKEELEFINLELDGLKHLPPATPIRPKGHWISRWHAGHDLHFHVCSECNEEFSCDMETGISIDDYRYCPNCGADMRTSEENDV